MSSVHSDPLVWWRLRSQTDTCTDLRPLCADADGSCLPSGSWVAGQLLFQQEVTPRPTHGRHAAHGLWGLPGGGSARVLGVTAGGWLSGVCEARLRTRVNERLPRAARRGPREPIVFQPCSAW